MSQRTAARHEYAARLEWTGNRGPGTSAYDAYGREYRVHLDGKPPIEGSADAAFRGDPARLNPEDLFLAALSSCHMLAYLALCARGGVRVTAYRDDASGTLALHAGGGGCFEEVTLRPEVTVADAGEAERAEQLHHDAHERCFIAASCNVPVRIVPTIRAATAEVAA